MNTDDQRIELSLLNRDRSASRGEKTHYIFKLGVQEACNLLNRLDGTESAGHVTFLQKVAAADPMATWMLISDLCAMSDERYVRFRKKFVRDVMAAAVAPYPRGLSEPLLDARGLLIDIEGPNKHRSLFFNYLQHEDGNYTSEPTAIAAAINDFAASVDAPDMKAERARMTLEIVNSLRATLARQSGAAP